MRFRWLLLWAFVAGLLTATDQTTRGDDAPKSERSTAELLAALKPSVVVITFTGRDGKQEGLGTGFVISADGLIATNLHVIGEGRPISVAFPDGTKRDVTAIHASDRQLDLAIVKIDSTGLKPLELGDSEAAQDGQPVVAIGNPLGLKHSVVEGILSGRRDIDGRKMLQLAMPIEQGNSGGPVVDRHGKVLGLITLKSLVTQNLGFAVSINSLKPLIDKPNPIPMTRWLTIGQLNAREWTPLFGANWRQRAGRITTEGMGQGFGGRSLCLSKQAAPEGPFELSVSVKFSPEDGAAGLVFHSDGNDKHYGFYPSNGGLRLSRFDGPDVFQWKVLQELRHEAYRPSEWNDLKVRIEKNRLQCFVNGQMVIESTDDGLTAGQVGLAKFRHTSAEFRRFKISPADRTMDPGSEGAQRIAELVRSVPAQANVKSDLLSQLASESSTAGSLLRERARELEQQAERLKQLALDVHVKHAQSELHRLLHKKTEDQIDLFSATLWLAALDNEELDVADYVKQLDALAADLRQSFPVDADEAAKLAALKKFFFEELGFHGGRLNYYARSNNHLNEVLDDREGMPITLSIVFMELGRRVEIPIVGVGLPSHFVVRHEPKEGEPQLIDVFEGGEALTRQAAEELIFKNTNRPARDEHFVTAKRKDILIRVLSNLLRRAQDERDAEAMFRYVDTILTINPDAADYRAMRFEIAAFTRRFDQANIDADWLRDQKPEGVDLDRVEEIRRRLNVPK